MMKEITNLIDKYNTKADNLRCRMHELINAGMPQEASGVQGELFQLGDFITDLEKLNEKILNAQDKSRSVTLHEESKEVCSHKALVCTRDSTIFQCYYCGQLIKGKLDDSGGSMPHEG